MLRPRRQRNPEIPRDPGRMVVVGFTFWRLTAGLPGTEEIRHQEKQVGLHELGDEVLRRRRKKRGEEEETEARERHYGRKKKKTQTK